MPFYLTIEEVLLYTEALVGPSSVRELGLLASAMTIPQMSVFGQDAYPDLASKAAIMLYSICRNHPLVDGNERLAWTCARAFLLLNDADMSFEVDEAEQMVLAVATGDMDPQALSAIIRHYLVGSAS